MSDYPAWLRADRAPHPAKYSAPVALAIVEMIEKYSDGTILDPFGGTGGLHHIGEVVRERKERYVITFVNELEAEWATESAEYGLTRCGDFFTFEPGVSNKFWMKCDKEDPNFVLYDDKFDMIITSPTYGNRMADKHTPGKCKECNGTGDELMDSMEAVGVPGGMYPIGPCPTCKGKGRENSKRMTYKHQLGRDLSDNNSGGMQWGPAYRTFHGRAWMRVKQLLTDDGYFILNVKDHVRAGKIIKVAQWHVDTALRLGFDVLDRRWVHTSGMGFGQHQQTLKVDHEEVIVFTKG